MRRYILLLAFLAFVPGTVQASHHSFAYRCRLHKVCLAAHPYTRFKRQHLRHEAWQRWCLSRPSCRQNHPELRPRSISLAGLNNYETSAAVLYNDGIHREAKLVVAVSLCIQESQCSLIQNSAGAPAFGAWQCYQPAHPWCDTGLLNSSWTYNAYVFLRLSHRATDWQPWTCCGDSLYEPGAVGPVERVLRRAAG